MHPGVRLLDYLSLSHLPLGLCAEETMVRETRHLWVGNLPESVDDRQVINFFSRRAKNANGRGNRTSPRRLVWRPDPSLP